MRISNLFRKLRQGPAGVRIRQKISSWPGYQQVPDPQSIDGLKSKARELLSLISMTLIMDRPTKSRIHTTKQLRNSEKNDVLLIGSGPSAKLLTADQVQHFQNNGGSIAVMNGFFLTELSKEITVDYYFIADPCFWEEKFLEIKTEIESYVKRSRNHIKIVQPAHLKPIVENYANYLFWDGRSRAGLVRSSRPDKPWGLPASVALYAIGTLKFLGHKRLFFTGLDSSYVNYYKVNDLNYVSHSPQGQHSYDEDERTINLGESGSIEVKHQRPFRHLADLNFAHGIFLRDMYWLCHDYCINVGNDTTNDSAPRASLLPRM